MEDLTEKTGNYIYPSFFYNGMLYGYGQGIERVKTDLDLTYCEEIEQLYTAKFFSGSRFLRIVCDQDGIAKISAYNMQTEALETYEIPGLEKSSNILCVDDEYIYFYQKESIYLGDIWYKDELKPCYKTNNGSIYRVNLDGTGLVCIYEEEDFEITGQEAVIAGDKILQVASEIPVTQADDVVDLTGLSLAPGFIDAHSHNIERIGDASFFVNHSLLT
jgi:hypothetical protein